MLNEKQLKPYDRRCQSKVIGRRSFYSSQPAEVLHHFIHRSNRVLRYDYRNLIPLTYEEHNLLHANNISLKKWHYEDELIIDKNILIKDELIILGLTERQYYEMKLGG